MVTYASPKALKWTLLVVDSFIFVISVIFFITTIVEFIGYEKESDPGGDDDHGDNFEDDLFNEKTDESFTLVIQHFPSVGSVPAKFLLATVTMCVSIVGIVAANGEDLRLLTINGYICFLSFFLKYLIIVVSIKMNGLGRSFKPLGSITVPFYLGIGLFELLLAMSSCQFSSILKRGDAAEPRILKLPVS